MTDKERETLEQLRREADNATRFREHFNVMLKHYSDLAQKKETEAMLWKYACYVLLFFTFLLWLFRTFPSHDLGAPSIEP